LPKNRLKNRFHAKCNQTVIFIFDCDLDKLNVEVKNLTYHNVNYGAHRVRRSYAKIKEVLPLPNLIDIQTNSYKWFLDEGLKDMFDDIMPIDDFAGNLSLEYVDYKLLEPKYTVESSSYV